MQSALLKIIKETARKIVAVTIELRLLNRIFHVWNSLMVSHEAIFDRTINR